MQKVTSISKITGYVVIGLTNVTGYVQKVIGLTKVSGYIQKVIGLSKVTGYVQKL